MVTPVRSRSGGVDSEANDQDTVLRLCEQLAQHNTGVSRRAGEIGPARYQLESGGIAARLQPRCESVKQQCCVLRSQPRSE
jgi:hypothetical protein